MFALPKKFSLLSEVLVCFGPATFYNFLSHRPDSLFHDGSTGGGMLSSARAIDEDMKPRRLRSILKARFSEPSYIGTGTYISINHFHYSSTSLKIYTLMSRRNWLDSLAHS